MKKVVQIILVLMVLICIYCYTKSEATISLAQEPDKEDYASETGREIENGTEIFLIKDGYSHFITHAYHSCREDSYVKWEVPFWDVSNGKNSSIYESNKLDIWLGRYGFTDTFEHNSGKINYVVDYEIIIYKDDGKYYAELEDNGWFLQTRSLAYVEGDENSIDIIFKSSLPGDSLYGIVERYEEDELMLTLSYDDSELISSWHVLRKEHPIFIESEEEINGIYFEKLDESITSLSALPSYRKKEINSEDLDIWLGAYSYSELYEFDNENVDVNFGLIIYKVDGNYYAEFNNSGYALRSQDYSVLLQSRSLAYIKGNEKSIDIYFKRTLPGDSLYGISERYKSNELLLTLTYSDSGLQSTWHALQGEEPVKGGSNERMEGIYFGEIYKRTTK